MCRNGAKCVYNDLLVGSTGFVGGNLMAKHDFTAVCHSKDVAAQYGTRPDLCVYAGVPAAMFWPTPIPKQTWRLWGLPGKICAASPPRRWC